MMIQLVIKCAILFNLFDNYVALGQVFIAVIIPMSFFFIKVQHFRI